jgi:hypothetical protein
MYKVLVAAALLTTPWEVVPLQDVAQMHADLAPALRHLAIDWEILDRRETHYLLSTPQDFEADLKLLHDRFRELSTAPHVAEVARFPSRDMVNDLLAFNRSYREDLNARLDLDLVHGEELRAALMETDLLYRIWDCVHDARCEFCFTPVRRQALQQLRDLVGDAAFYSGQLPPHVPVWRFPIGN